MLKRITISPNALEVLDALEPSVSRDTQVAHLAEHELQRDNHSVS